MIKALRDFFFGPSMHARYKLERDGVQMIEKSYGFITYKLEANALCVMELYILPAYRGRGFGKKLMQEAREVAAKRGLGFLTVIETKGDHTSALRAIFQEVGLKPKGKVSVDFELYVEGVS